MFARHGVWAAPAVLFLFGVVLYIQSSFLFISPDETAGAFFIRAFAETGSLRVPFDAMSGILHPRSMVADGMFLLPGSFLGLIVLYGAFAAVFGMSAVVYVSAALVLLAAFAWRQILQRWFSDRVANVAGLLMLFHPAVWYYTARGLMPNVLLVCCLIFSAWFFLKGIHRQKDKQNSRRAAVLFGIAGVCLGWALFVRLSEIYWILPLFGVFLYAERANLSLKTLLLFAIGTSLPLVLMLVLHAQTYGNPFVFGYQFVSSHPPFVTIPSSIATESVTRLGWILPFGFHPRAIFWHTYDYLFRLFWWLTLPTLFALGLVWKHPKQRAYTAVVIVVAAWLCVWYGSWRLNDNPDPTQLTIANSYIRYWLPVFVLSTPLLARTLVSLAERARTARVQTVVLFSSVLVLVVLNMRVVFFQGQDALVRMMSVLQTSEQIQAHVLSLVPEQGIIITDRSDKIFFPKRRVLVPLRSEQTYTAIPLLMEHVPVYYYGITLPEKDLTFLNEQILLPHGVRMQFIQSFGVESLYYFQKP